MKKIHRISTEITPLELLLNPFDHPQSKEMSVAEDISAHDVYTELACAVGIDYLSERKISSPKT